MYRPSASLKMSNFFPFWRSVSSTAAPAMPLSFSSSTLPETVRGGGPFFFGAAAAATARAATRQAAATLARPPVLTQPDTADDRAWPRTPPDCRSRAVGLPVSIVLVFFFFTLEHTQFDRIGIHHFQLDAAFGAVHHLAF